MNAALRPILLAAACSAVWPAHAQTTDAGKRVFDHWCAACHAASLRAPGTTALAAKYDGAKPAPLEQRTDLTPQVVAYFVRNGVSIMPTFRKTEITDAELSALAGYLSHAEGRKP